MPRMTPTSRATKALFDTGGESIDADGYPHLPAIQWADGLTTVWCRHCLTIHTHGRGGGHRVAHCAEGGRRRGAKGSYAATGYFVDVVRDEGLEVGPDVWLLYDRDSGEGVSYLAGPYPTLQAMDEERPDEDVGWASVPKPLWPVLAEHGPFALRYTKAGVVLIAEEGADE